MTTFRSIIRPVILGSFCGSMAFAVLFASTGSTLFTAARVQQPLSSHAVIRASMVSLELPQITGLTESFNVLLGDSIFEALYTGVSSIPIVNAAIGGGGVDATLSMLDIFTPYKGKIDTIILGIGINDAYSGLVNLDKAGRAAYLENWANRYESIVNKSRQLARSVYLLPVLPVEENKELGTKYFDVDIINQMNKKINEISTISSAPVVSLPPKLAGNGNGIAHQNSTTDGVHPNAQTYAELRQIIIDILSKNGTQKKLE